MTADTPRLSPRKWIKFKYQLNNHGLLKLPPTRAEGLYLPSIFAETFADKNNDATLDYTQLTLESTEAIAFWQHFAIMAVLQLKGLKLTERQILERLNIPLGIA